MSKAHWRESAIGTGYQSIDKIQGVIRGVKVIGNESRNGRRYRQKTLVKAIPIYEGSRVYLDHVIVEKNGKAHPRGIKDKWGVLKNVRESEDGRGLRADLHYLLNHQSTPVLIEAAERFPETFGLSHDASGDEISIGNGIKEVTEIHKVNSVDIVNDPATNSGLFESKDFTMKKTIREIAANKTKFSKILEDMISGDPMMGDMPVDTSMATLDDAGEAIESSPEEQVEAAFKAAMVSVIDDSTMDIPSKLGKLKTIMQASEQALAAITGSDKKDPPKDSKETPATEGADTKTGNLQEQLDAAKLELEAIKTENECRRMLETAKRAVNPVRLKALASIPAADRTALVESWAEIRPQSAKPATSKSILDDPEHEDLEYKPKTKKEFMESFK